MWTKYKYEYKYLLAQTHGTVHVKAQQFKGSIQSVLYKCNTILYMNCIYYYIILYSIQMI